MPQMSGMSDRMQTQFTKTSSDLLVFVLKFVSGVVLGLTTALVMQVILGYAEDEHLLAFIFTVAVTAGIFLRIAKNWGLTAVMVFDLICILAGMLLKLYIMVAPEA